MPPEIILIAIEAGDTTTISDEPTPKVQNAIKTVVKIIIDNVAAEERC
jgi:hypothetical protein